MTTSLTHLFNNSKQQLFTISIDSFCINSCNYISLNYLDKSLDEIKGVSIDEFFTINLNKKETIINELKTLGIYHTIDRATDRNISATLISHNGIREILIRVDLESETDKNREVILDENVAGYCRINTELKLLDCNNTLATQLGYKYKEDLINKPISAILSEKEEIGSLIKTIVNRRKIKNIELRLKDKLGKDQTCLANIILEKDDTGINKAISFTLIDISERVEFENRTKQSEERFKLLSNVAIEGIVFLDKRIIIDSNEQFIELIGGSNRQEIIGRDIIEFIDHKELVKINIPKNTLQQKRTEIIAKKKDGTIMLLEASSGNINQQGQEIDILLFYEITQIKKTEKALAQSTERYKSLVENSPNGIFILVNNQIKFTNNAGVKLLEYAIEDNLYNKNFIDFIDEEFRESIDISLLETRGGGDLEYKEIKMQTSIKRHINIGIQASLTVFNNKPAVQVTIVDLTTQLELREEKIRNKIAEKTNLTLTKEIKLHTQTQEKLQAAQKFTQNIIESSIDMIIAVNKDNKITEFNKAAINEFGYLLEEVLGKDVSMLFADKNEYQRVSTSVNKKGIFTGETTTKRKNRETFVSLLSSSVIKSSKGVIQGFMGVLRDITERKIIEQQVKDSLKEKEVLLQEVHHRVKNNLQVISSILSLQSNYIKDDKTLEILAESQNRIRSMSYIHETLYQTTDFSSIEFSNYLDALASNLIHSYSYSSGTVQLVTDYDKIYLTIDQAIPCGLIVNEIVSNAMKHAFEGKDGEVYLSIKESQGKIHLRVGDNGKGLPKHFKHAESDSLGMQLVYSLIDQLDASLDLQADKGTDFLITFEKS